MWDGGLKQNTWNLSADLLLQGASEDPLLLRLLPNNDLFKQMFWSQPLYKPFELYSVFQANRRAVLANAKLMPNILWPLLRNSEELILRNSLSYVFLFVFWDLQIEPLTINLPSYLFHLVNDWEPLWDCTKILFNLNLVLLDSTEIISTCNQEIYLIWGKPLTFYQVEKSAVVYPELTIFC